MMIIITVAIIRYILHTSGVIFRCVTRIMELNSGPLKTDPTSCHRGNQHANLLP